MSFKTWIYTEFFQVNRNLICLTFKYQGHTPYYGFRNWWSDLSSLFFPFLILFTIVKPVVTKDNKNSNKHIWGSNTHDISNIFLALISMKIDHKTLNYHIPINNNGSGNCFQFNFFLSVISYVVANISKWCLVLSFR